MVFNIQLLKGVLEQKNYIYQLEKAEVLRGIWSRLLLLLAFSTVISVVASYYGVGMDFISRELEILSVKEFETNKFIVASGKVLWALCYVALILLFPTVLFWVFFGIEFKKLVSMQLVVLLVLLLEKLLLLPFEIFIGIGKESSPFALGNIASLLIANKWFVYLFGAISIVKVWVIQFQYKCLMALDDRRPLVILAVVVFVNLVAWCATATVLFLSIEKLL
jgi:hypothetical protein